MNRISFYEKKDTAGLFRSLILFLSFLLLSFPPQLLALPGDGSGQVRVNPSRVPVSTECVLSFTFVGTQPDLVESIRITVPGRWKWTGKITDVQLRGTGLQLSTVDSITGMGVPGDEWKITIKGASITDTRGGDITLQKITSPDFIAPATSPHNIFRFESAGTNGALTAIANNPGIETYLGETGPILQITEAVINDPVSDWVEIYVIDDSNFGNGIDLAGYSLQSSDSPVPEKNFSSVLVKTGNFILLHYNRPNTPDDSFPVDNVVNVYTGYPGLRRDDGQLWIKDANGNYMDALSYANRDGTYNNKNIIKLVDAREWDGIDEKDQVNVKNLREGDSISRIWFARDTNSARDWLVTNTPSPGSENRYVWRKPDIRINELSFNTPASDWLELFVADDGSGGGGTDLGGFVIKGGNTVFKKISTGTIAKTGDYIVLHFNSGLTDEKKVVGDCLDLYTTHTGLEQVSQQITVQDNCYRVLDAVCYAEGELDEKAAENVRLLIMERHWSDCNPLGIYDRQDCVDTSGMPENTSIARDDRSADTDSKTDWRVERYPTPGKRNLKTGLAVKLSIFPSGNVFTLKDKEVKVEVTALDREGKRAINSFDYIRLVSDGTDTLFSVDGVKWSSKATLMLKYGAGHFWVKDSTPGRKGITLAEATKTLPLERFILVVGESWPIIFTEIMARVPETLTVERERAQYIELHNASSSRFELSGYSIVVDSTYSYTFPAGSIIEPGEYLVLARKLMKDHYRDPEAFANLYGNRDGKWDSSDPFRAFDAPALKLQNSGILELRNRDGVSMTRVAYSSLNAAGSLEKKNRTVPDSGDYQVDRYNWDTSGALQGSPGRPNSLDQEFPAVLEMSHSAVATARVKQELIIYCQAHRADSVELIWRNHAVGGIFTFTPMTRLDGTGVWRGVIPAQSVTLDGIDYYLRGKQGGVVQTIPEKADLEPYYVRVEDTVPRMVVSCPAKVIGPGQEFYADVLIENSMTLQTISFTLDFNSTYLQVVDSDPARSGVNVGIGSIFTRYFNSTNEADNSTGRISFSLEDLTGSARTPGTVARIKFKSTTAFGASFPEQLLLELGSVVINGSSFVEGFDGTVRLGLEAEGVVSMAGGVVEGPHGARLYADSNSTKKDVTVKIRRIPSEEIPKTNVLETTNGIRVTRIAYEYKPVHWKFDKPVTVEIPFTDAELAYYGITKKENLKIYYYDTSELAWRRLGGTVNKSSVSVKTNQLEVFLLVQDERSAGMSITAVESFPNPFSPDGNGFYDETFLSFILSDDAVVDVDIYDVRGRRVRKLVEQKKFPAGLNKISWNGRDEWNRILRTGVYIYSIRALDEQAHSAKVSATVVLSKNMND